ncbi:MAG: hypothetical protein Q8R83_07680 [Legionellaceae bacterium]|nr:hypothetical protein [Legionellaceae bacterium]
MKRLMVLLAASLMALGLGACGKRETKPEAVPVDTTTMEQPAEPKADEQKTAEDAPQADTQTQTQE